MSQALSTRKNPYWDNPKNSTVYTPKCVADFLHRIISSVLLPKVILDPAIGRGALTNPWKKNSTIVGVDVDPKSKRYADHFVRSRFEDLEHWSLPYPNLILVNPPWNGANGRKLYPEVFLRKIVDLFGKDVPTVLFVPMGFRLNQRMKSKRWQWLNGIGMGITSIVSLPLNVFEKVEFHSEILLFNMPKLKAHYWIETVAEAA